jgi:hypothetical protein
MTVIAHFTTAELPGTFALVLVGLLLGLAAARRPVAGIPAFALLAVLIAAAALGDPLHLPTAAKLGIDVAWLVLAATLSLQALRGARR